MRANPPWALALSFGWRACSSQHAATARPRASLGLGSIEERARGWALAALRSEVAS